MIEQRFHDQLGEEYELFKLACPHYDDLQDSVRELIKKEFENSSIEEIRVLEIGFGAGATSIIILDADERVDLTAIDDEPIMLPKTAQKLKSIDSNRCHLFTADALSFLNKCQDDSFDVVASAWVIHNFTNEYRYQVLKEIYRVLKLDGIFINADKIETTDREQHAKNMHWQLKEFEVYERIGKPELKKEWTEHYLEDSKVGRALIENEFEQNIKLIGFSSFEVLKRWHDDAVSLIKK